MSASAITMLVISILVVGGGLLASVITLINHPESEED
ncbi:methionine/alanine import family NSS transporter small subunit [Glycomyces terrestris]|uniref:Methionine/alanine import family NSS transporter small subunit n=1 Tax=Glycomyces terrestris TaxID=2493553 RepID=A0A426V548_9ACTN|nr:methionine/alanine import family NSS transporter small subunit [Glycomyces terrestris]RRS02024.1 methionine/alanine import family NSS transporter small subunit [Glycomyces terrestris]